MGNIDEKQLEDMTGGEREGGWEEERKEGKKEGRKRDKM